MELPQFEGLTPLSHFAHNSGKSGHTSVLTYSRGNPSTASSIIVRLNEQARAPKGLSLRLRDGLVDKPILNANGDRFFRTDKTVAMLSQEYDILGVDVAQSDLGACDYDNPIRFDVFETFEDFNQARLVFYAHSSQIMRLVSNELFANFRCFQPFVHAFGDGTSLYAYLPLGQHKHAFFVVTKDDRSKLLTMDTSPNDPICYMNHWSFFVKEEVEDFYDEEKTITGASLVMTNLFKDDDDGLSFFYADRKFSWPRTIFSCCAECFAETSMSQLCGGHFCYTAQSFSHLEEETYKTAIDNVRRGYERLNERAKDYHLVSKLTKVSSSIVLFDNMPPTLSSSTIRNAEDSFIVRVNGSVFDVKIDFGRVIDAFENTIPHADDAIVFSPLFKRQGFFFYVKKDGLLVLQDDIFDDTERKVYGRIVPKEAENVKLFLPLRNTVYCYWTVGRKHYMTNLGTFLANGILGATEHRE